MIDEDDVSSLVAELVNKIERSFYGKYRGIVVDNADPEKLGRIKVRVPSVLGPDVVSGWALPCMPYGGATNQGFFMIPEAESSVWVEFEEGDLEFPIWVGSFWSKGESGSEAPKPVASDASEGELEETPTRKIIKTAKGHTIQIEDKDGDESILVMEGSKKHFLLMDQDGITIQDAKGNSLVMSEASVTLTAKCDLVIDASGSALTLKAKSIDLEKA